MQALRPVRRLRRIPQEPPRLSSTLSIPSPCLDLATNQSIAVQGTRHGTLCAGHAPLSQPRHVPTTTLTLPYRSMLPRRRQHSLPLHCSLPMLQASTVPPQRRCASTRPNGSQRCETACGATCYMHACHLSICEAACSLTRPVVRILPPLPQPTSPLPCLPPTSPVVPLRWRWCIARRCRGIWNSSQAGRPPRCAGCRADQLIPRS